MLARIGILFALVLSIASGGAATAPRAVTVRGAEMHGFGRIALEFEQPSKVSVGVENGVLILGFGGTFAIRGERLAAELPGYVSLVRRDPDGTGLRIALAGPFRSSVLEAAERVFIDLLPQSWTGLPPGLPQDVVDELARRAREAEAKLRQDDRRRQLEATPIAVRVAQLPTLTRAVFTPPQVVPVSFSVSGDSVELRFDGPLSLDANEARSQLAPAVRAVSTETVAGSLVVRLSLEPGYEARAFREDETFVVDLAKPRPPVALNSESGAPAPEQAPPAEEAAGSMYADVSPADLLAALPPGPGPSGADPLAPDAPMHPVATVSTDGLQILFPFGARVDAAAFERDGVITAAFHTPKPVEAPGLPSEASRFVLSAEATREADFAIVRLKLPQRQLVRMEPQDAAWVLIIGHEGSLPSDPVTVWRKVDEAGRANVALALPEAADILWTTDPDTGERLAVVTSSGLPRGVPKLHRFVEFGLLPTAHGVVVAAAAEDLAVQIAGDAVLIWRPAGLSISWAGTARDGLGGAQTPEFAISREQWAEDQRKAPLEHFRALLQAAADAPPNSLAEARLDLARFLLAIGLNAEARSVLTAAVWDDPTLAQRSHVVLLRAVAAARTGRTAEARKHLSANILAEEPEAALWRAVVDARERRWKEALAGFRRTNLLLDFYPDDLQGPIRLLAARAALETGDHGYADNELASVGLLVDGAYAKDEAALLKARVEEATDRAAAALSGYVRLASQAERPVAAEATLRWITLALRTGSMQREEAVERLETLALTWRGGDIEIGTIGQLGRLYGEVGRWRDAFTMARRANLLFPDHDVSRALHEAAGRLFEELFLTGKSETLSRIDALALYFDFKEFTPIDRRGDEIVRRLADHLVEMDLLDQASELLQYQIDNRLSGAARATVAARLAMIRLMDGKPGQALAALHATRLPDLPATTRRARTLLEARALSDLSRTDFALELLQGESGPDIDRLRADILWSARRWREAGEAHERLVGTRWQGAEPLSDRDRADVLRAGIAYTLGDEKLGLDRLRAKFAAKMADSADASAFAFLTRPNVANTRAFRDMARGVTSADTLADFLVEFRKRHPEAAAADRRHTPEPKPAVEPASPSKPEKQSRVPAPARAAERLPAAGRS